MKTRILFLGLLLTFLFSNKINGQIIPDGNCDEVSSTYWTVDSNIVISPIADASITSFSGLVLNSPNNGNFTLKSSNFTLFANDSYQFDIGMAYFARDNNAMSSAIIPLLQMSQYTVVLKDSQDNVIVSNTMSSTTSSYAPEGFPIDYFKSNTFNINITGSYYIEISGPISYTQGGTDYLNSPGKETFIFDNIEIVKNLDHKINGKVSFDSSNTCSTSSSPLNYIQLKSIGANGTYYTSTNSNGDYAFAFEENGSVLTEIITNGLTLNPVNLSNNFITGTPQTETNQDFCVSSSTTGDDVSVIIIPTSDARPGFQSSYKIKYTNTGSTTVSGDVVLNFEDNKMNSPIATPVASSSTSNSLTFNYSSLTPFETRTIDIEFTNNTPTQTTNPLNGGDVLNFAASITPLTTDVNQSDNNFTLVQPVVNSYDPNDATILEGAQITAQQATQDLHFRIRFQNTGSASAININVQTMLDADLDWATFTPISSSHSYNTSVNTTTGEVNFNFPNINLADSTTDEPNSHGWVLFKAKPKTSFAIGDKIDCGANIFFDYNFPIITNVAQTEIFVPSNLYTAIPDAAFEQALLDLGIDTEGTYDGRVLTSDISGITTLDISDPLNNPSFTNVTAKISSLVGLEDFVSLQVLNVSNNNISSIDISNLSALYYLLLSNNPINILDTSQNSNLLILQLNNTGLTSLDITSNSRLESLNIDNTPLTFVDTRQNPNLKTFSAEIVPLTSVDLSQNPLLEYLELRYNNLSSLDISNNLQLQIFVLTGSPFISLDLSNHKQLNEIRINNNSQLTQLKVNNNFNTNISTFNFNVINNPNLTCIQVDNVTYSNTNWTNKDPQHVFSATTCPNALTYVPDDNLETYLETHDANGNVVPLGDPASMGNATSATDPLDNYVLTSRINTVTSLQVPSLSISDMTGIQDFAALERLSVNDNTISALNVSSNTALIELNCSSNQLTALDVSSNTVLKTLFCDANQIAVLNVNSNPALEFLSTSHNKISTLDVSSNPLLQNLAAGNNKLSVLDVSANPALTSLSCDNNLLTALDVTINTGLIFLGIQNNQITSLNVSTNSALTQLWVSFNQLTSLNIANGNNTGLTIFNSTGNSGLTCITADASTPGTGLTGWVKDGQHTFSANCNLNCTADTNSTNEDTTLTVSATNGLLANDSGTTLSVSAIAIGTTTYTVGTLFTITEGDITINSDGSYTYTPALNFNGAVPQITYTLSDGTATTTCTLDITVTPVNDAPIAVDDTITASSGNPITANDTDVDGTIDASTIILIDPNNTSNTGNSSTPLVVSGVGTFTIDVSGNISFTADAGFTGTTVTVNYTVNDNDGLTSNSATITITVNSGCAVTSIPDINFEQALINQNIDTDGVINGKVCTSDINTIKDLAIEYNSIQDLTGIEGFVALEELSMEGNPLTTMPDLSQNVLLEELNMNSCQITSLDLTQNIKLDKLELYDNALTTINVSKNVLLRTLFIGKNNLTNIDVSFNTELKSLGIGRNSISTVNLTNNLKLKGLTIEENKFKILDVSFLPVLNNLDANDNELTQLNIANGNNSSFLFLETRNNTGLTCIQADTNAGPSGNVTKEAYHVFNTNCSYVALTYVPDDNFENYLETHNANGGLVALGDATSLGNGIANDDYVFTSSIDALTNLRVSNLGIKDMTGIEDFLALERLNVDDNQLLSLDVSKNLDLFVLDCKNNMITDLDISKNLKLEYLRCQNNRIDNLILNPNLNTIEADNNLLSSIDVTICSNLEYLSVPFNQLKGLDITQNNSLLGLEIHDNLLEELDITYNTLLTHIYANNNLITEVKGLDVLTDIIQLHVVNNKIKHLDLSNITRLSTLRCENNLLESLNLSSVRSTSFNFGAFQNPNLSCIQVVFFQWSNWPAYITNGFVDSTASFSTDCSSVWTVMTNPTTTTALLTVAGLDADNDGEITIAEAAAYTGVLDLSGSGITDVEGLQAFTGITTLDVSGNGITDLSPLTNSSFTVVSKSTGKTKTIAKTTTMALETLIVSDNTFEVLDVSTLTNLKKLVIKNNPNLITVSLKNGNNSNITFFDSSNTPNLTCILVDDSNAMYLSTWTKDSKNTFVTDEAQCRAEVLSVDNFDITNTITLYPNPVTDYLKIELSNQLEIQNIQVYNVIGKLVNETKKTAIDFTKMTKGIYLLKIITDKGIATKKVIKN